MNAMKTTIDPAGRLVIPKQIREQAGLLPGVPLSIRASDGVVEITAAATPVRLVKKGRFTVAEPSRGTPALTADLVESTRESLRGPR